MFSGFLGSIWVPDTQAFTSHHSIGCSPPQWTEGLLQCPSRLGQLGSSAASNQIDCFFRTQPVRPFCAHSALCGHTKTLQVGERFMENPTAATKLGSSVQCTSARQGVFLCAPPPPPQDWPNQFWWSQDCGRNYLPILWRGSWKAWTQGIRPSLRQSSWRGCRVHDAESNAGNVFGDVDQVPSV